MMNKNKWKLVSDFSCLSFFPALPCPYCSSDTLSLENESIQYRTLSGEALSQCIKKFQLSKSEKAGSENSLSSILIAALEIATQAFQTPSQFLAFFKCTMCNQSVSSFGIAKVPVETNNSDIQIKVESFNPPIPIFKLHQSTPGSINDELAASFSYFFSDTCSSGIRLRRALEKLCEDDILDCYEIFQVVLSLFQRKEIEDKTNKVATQLENKYQRLKG